MKTSNLTFFLIIHGKLQSELYNDLRDGNKLEIKLIDEISNEFGTQFNFFNNELEFTLNNILNIGL